MIFDSRLERAVVFYCGELRNEHKKQRRVVINNGKRKAIWDLPCVAVACRGVQPTIFKDFSKPVRVDTYDRVPLLRDALLECGDIGGPTHLKGCGNQVGRCAEPHAAKRCMLEFRSTGLDDIIFSTARNIRTGEPKAACKICTTVFPNLQ